MVFLQVALVLHILFSCAEAKNYTVRFSNQPSLDVDLGLPLGQESTTSAQHCVELCSNHSRCLTSVMISDQCVLFDYYLQCPDGNQQTTTMPQVTTPDVSL